MYRFNRITLFPILLLAASAWANENDKRFTDANVDIWVGLTTHEKGVNVSGTNVNCGFRVAWGAQDGNAGNPWDQVAIVSLRVTCDTMDELLTPRPGPIGPTFSKTIRIASTHFADGSTISFTIKGKLSFEDTTPGGLGSKVEEFTHVATLKAYNKAISMATQEEFYKSKGDSDPIPTGYKLPGEPGHENLYPAMSRTAAAYARGSLAGPLNHTVKPNVAPFDVWRESSGTLKLNEEMSKVTFFYAASHGEPLLFRASLCEVSNRLSDEVTFETDVPAYIARPPDIPGYNMVIVNACDTCAISNYNLAPKKFGMVPADYPA